MESPTLTLRTPVAGEPVPLHDVGPKLGQRLQVRHAAQRLQEVLEGRVGGLYVLGGVVVVRRAQAAPDEAQHRLAAGELLGTGTGIGTTITRVTEGQSSGDRLTMTVWAGEARGTRPGGYTGAWFLIWEGSRGYGRDGAGRHGG